MEESITEIISQIEEKINNIVHDEDNKTCLLQLCKDIREKTKAEALRYDTKFIETTIRQFGYALPNEINKRCKLIVPWYSAIREENEYLQKQLLSKDFQICLLQRDLENKDDCSMSKEMQDAYDHMQKVKTRKLRYREDIKDEEIALLYKQGKGATEIGKKLGCSRQTVINRLKGMQLWRKQE